MLDILLLIVRWCCALFLLALMFVALGESAKGGPRDLPRRVTVQFGLLLGCVCLCAACGLIFLNWAPFLLPLRLAGGALLFISGFEISASRKLRNLKEGIKLLSIAAALGGCGLCLMAWIWDWRLGLLGSILCLGMALLLRPYIRLEMDLTYLRWLSKIGRPAPLSTSEAKERLVFGKETAEASLTEERELGRVMNSDELAVFVEKFNAAAAAEADRIKLDETEQKAIEALDQEMKTNGSAPRVIALKLDAACDVNDCVEGKLSGERLFLAAGEHELWLKLQFAYLGSDTTAIIDVWQEGKPKVSHEVYLPRVIDLGALRQAYAWRARDPGWRESFCSSVLLERIFCSVDKYERMEFTVDDKKIAFSSRYGSFSATLACPAPSDQTWCRVHNLGYVELDSDGNEGEWMRVDPFCFPLNIEALLKFDEHID